MESNEKVTVSADDEYVPVVLPAAVDGLDTVILGDAVSTVQALGSVGSVSTMVEEPSTVAVLGMVMVTVAVTAVPPT